LVKSQINTIDKSRKSNYNSKNKSILHYFFLLFLSFSIIRNRITHTGISLNILHPIVIHDPQVSLLKCIRHG